MNYLAHFFLSADDEALMLGNFLADYLNNAQVEQLPPLVQAGVRLHRQIDSFTDQHPEVRKGVRRLYKRHSKYAPVLIDVFYDYLLSLNWNTYSQQPLADFIQQTYAALQRHHSLMPQPVHAHLPHMIADNWLETYSTHNGIAYVLRRMRPRLSRPELFDGALDSLAEDFYLLNEEFNQFFPDIMAFVGAKVS